MTGDVKGLSTNRYFSRREKGALAGEIGGHFSRSGALSRREK
jgi:hypothetical protein